MRTFLPFLAMSVCFPPIMSFGQEKDAVGIFQSRNEYNQFFGGLKSLRDPEINALLPMINDIVLGRPIGSTPSKGGGNGMMGVLGDPKVRDELEIVDFQYEELKELNFGNPKTHGPTIPVDRPLQLQRHR